MWLSIVRVLVKHAYSLYPLMTISRHGTMCARVLVRHSLTRFNLHPFAIIRLSRVSITVFPVSSDLCSLLIVVFAVRSLALHRVRLTGFNSTTVEKIHSIWQQWAEKCLFPWRPGCICFLHSYCMERNSERLPKQLSRMIHRCVYVCVTITKSCCDTKWWVVLQNDGSSVLSSKKSKKTCLKQLVLYRAGCNSFEINWSLTWVIFVLVCIYCVPSGWVNRIILPKRIWNRW